MVQLIIFSLYCLKDEGSCFRNALYKRSFDERSACTIICAFIFMYTCINIVDMNHTHCVVVCDTKLL